MNPALATRLYIDRDHRIQIESEYQTTECLAPGMLHQIRICRAGGPFSDHLVPVII